MMIIFFYNNDQTFRVGGDASVATCSVGVAVTNEEGADVAVTFDLVLVRVLEWLTVEGPHHSRLGHTGDAAQQFGVVRRQLLHVGELLRETGRLVDLAYCRFGFG